MEEHLRRHGRAARLLRHFGTALCLDRRSLPYAGRRRESRESARLVRQ